MTPVPFTKHQLDAVDVARRELNACVVAGPGSGKTTVLVEYFSRLVAAGVDPGRILAITFTEKAAGNMRAKLAGAFEKDAGMRAKLERAWVSTVHGFCARLLKENEAFVQKPVSKQELLEAVSLLLFNDLQGPRDRS